jgi:hypothetical protein
MNSTIRGVDQRSRVPVALGGSLLGLLALAAFSGTGVLWACILAILVMALMTQGWLFRWESMVGLIIVVIFFIPIRRYELPANLPIVLEPYRVVVGVVLFVWTLGLLVDRRVRVRRSGLEGPILAVVLAVVASTVSNLGRVANVNQHAIKALMFFASFLIVFYLVVSIARRIEIIDALLKTMVACGAVVAVFSLIEFRTGYNVFDHLSSLPGLRLVSLPTQFGDVTGFSRGGERRVYASAQHPIALGAALAMLVPPAIYIARKSGGLLWWAVAALSVVGVCATVGRTSIVMLLVIGLVFLIVRPVETRRFWPAIVPLFLLVHVAAPGTLGSLKASFFPSNGLIAQESTNNVGSGRLATLGPTLRREVYPNPLFGEGYGTRVVVADGDIARNAPITDDQWLNTAAETGLFGVAAWLWLLCRFIRRLGGLAKGPPDSDRTWLAAALAASVAAFTAGMFLYDAFSFIQVTFVLYFFLALGAAALRLPEEASASGRGQQVS